MKTNRDQLSHAFNHLRDDTLEEALTAMETNTPAVSKATHTRRWLTATAACLTAVLALGTVLTLPLLKTEDPVTPPSTELSAPELDATEEALFYYDTPLVKLLSLSTEDEDEGTTEDGTNVTLQLDEDIRMENSEDFRNMNILIFDCLPGETVTIRATTECLGYVDVVYNPHPEHDEWLNFYSAISMLKHRVDGEHLVSMNRKFTYCESELTFDPATSSVVLYMGYTAPEDQIEEDILRYTVTNEEGQITGAGALYVGSKYLEPMTHPVRVRHANTITRAAVLGSVRFTDPATVTEEQVETLLLEFAEAGKDGHNMVDFTPVTRSEITTVAYLEIKQTAFADQEISKNWDFIDSNNDYSFVGIKPDGAEEYRVFIIFADCTWAEVEQPAESNSLNEHTDPDCPVAADIGRHCIGPGCIIKITDGRIYQLKSYNPENEINTAILIHDPAA